MLVRYNNRCWASFYPTICRQMTETTEQTASGPLLKNRYRLGRVLGRGGMCIVYQAWDTRLGRNVAIKRLEPPLNQDPRTRARFDREGRALAQLSHPNVVTLIDRGSTENEEYLVFEYVEGRSLKELTRNGPLTVQEAGRIAGQVAEGLAVAHAAGIVHRDVKPQNILINRDGHAKVTDFGIAIGPDWTRVTRAGSIIGSARYMSPEQIRSRPVDGRSDIYSLGIVLYEMLAGRPPFDGTNMPEIARQHLRGEAPPLSSIRQDLPPGLEKIVGRCMEKLPEDRFSSMDELLGALVGLGLYSPEIGTDIESSKKSPRKGVLDGEITGEMTFGGTRRAREQARKDASTPLPQRLLGLAAAARGLPRRWKITGAAFVVGLILLIVLVSTLGGHSVPPVMGLTFEKAQEAAQKAGLEISKKEVASFGTTGLVIGQNPAACKKSADNILTVTVTRSPQPVAVTKIQDIDPEGDAEENPTELGALSDGNLGTGWSTESYKSADFGNLKSGVGLDFTLAQDATIIEIDTASKGWGGQLLTAGSGDASTQLAVLNGQTTQRITLTQGISAGRIWITKLVQIQKSPVRYGAQIAEIKFYW
jgi:eukaryotic-like serine/threonine-protein kinase